MALKAPGILTFMLSVVLVVTVMMIKFAGANVPGLSGHEFWGLLVAYLLLASGSLIRAL
jgi:hypothetical protein